MGSVHRTPHHSLLSWTLGSFVFVTLTTVPDLGFGIFHLYNDSLSQNGCHGGQEARADALSHQGLSAERPGPEKQAVASAGTWGHTHACLSGATAILQVPPPLTTNPPHRPPAPAWGTGGRDASRPSEGL